MKFQKILNGITMLAIMSIVFQPIIGMKLYYLIMGAMIMLTALNIIKKGKIKINFYELTLILFIVLEVISKLYAISQSTANYAIKETALSFFIAFFIVDYTQRNNSEVRYNKILDVFSTSTVILSIYLCIFDLPRVIGTRDRLGRLLFQEYGTYMVFSYLLIISICYMLWKCIYKIGNKLTYVELFILIITGFLSGTRKTIICPIIFGYILLLIKYRKNFIKIISFTLVGIIILIATYKILIINESLYKLIGNRIENIVETILYANDTKTSQDASLEERTLLKQLAIKAFNEKPILGWGINNFSNYSENNLGPFLYAHCNYLELLSSLGIVGTFIYYIGYIYIIIKALKKVKKNDTFSIYILSFMIMNLISDYETVNYYRVQYILLYVLFAKYLNDKKLKNGEIYENEKK